MNKARGHSRESTEQIHTTQRERARERGEDIEHTTLRLSFACLVLPPCVLAFHERAPARLSALPSLSISATRAGRTETSVHAVPAQGTPGFDQNTRQAGVGGGDADRGRSCSVSQRPMHACSLGSLVQVLLEVRGLFSFQVQQTTEAHATRQACEVDDCCAGL